MIFFKDFFSIVNERNIPKASLITLKNIQKRIRNNDKNTQKEPPPKSSSSTISLTSIWQDSVLKQVWIMAIVQIAQKVAKSRKNARMIFKI